MRTSQRKPPAVATARGVGKSFHKTNIQTPSPALQAPAVLFDCVRLSRGALVIPLCDGAGVLHSLQFIDNEGNKLFLSGVAFDGGNLLSVVQAIRAKFPNIAITLCVDNDTKTSGNPGLTKAREAALAVGGLLAVAMRGRF